MRFFDVAVNLLDPAFKGLSHRGKFIHEDDFIYVLKRAYSNGVRHMLVSCGTVQESLEAVRLIKELKQIEDIPVLYSTAGVHPAHAGSYSTESLVELNSFVQENLDVIKALGEMGLDYSEIPKKCNRADAVALQKHVFEEQIKNASNFNLPLFLHSRDCAGDFVEIVQKYPKLRRGVVHSFTGSLEEIEALLDMGLSISLSGASVRSPEYVRSVLYPAFFSTQRYKEFLMLETDAPWCGLRPGTESYSYVKTKFPTCEASETFCPGRDCLRKRNEPCHIVQVLEVLCGILTIDEVSNSISEHAFRNALDMFQLSSEYEQVPCPDQKIRK